MCTLVLGTSHINRLQNYLVRQHNANNLFNLNNYPPIYLHGISGGCVNNRVHVTRWERSIATFRPKVLVLHFGGNDLDSRRDVCDLISLKVVNLATTWRARYNVQSVVIVQLIPRLTPRHISSADYFTRTLEVNKMLKAECRHTDILYWKISGVKYPTQPIFCDGVHFNDDGMLRYFRSLRGAIIYASK